jgi:hypothetical protein
MTALKGEVTGENSIAVAGTATGNNSVGVFGKGDTNGVQTEGGANGVFAKGKGWCGIIGLSESTSGGFGVYGENTAGGTGVAGISKKWVGVYGETAGLENGPAGVWGEHKGAGIGVKAVSNTGVGLFAFSNGTAAVFQGDVEVSGDIRLTNADCAEDFNIGTSVAVDPGMVMVLGEDGALYPSQQAYDKRVAGVVSGAGDYKPGIVLDQQQSKHNRQPIALLGKVYCKVDTQYGAIEIGDLLTTSPTPGHAMKADDPAKAFGAVIGKALRPLQEGQGLIPILIALQ